jgi:hypothetical protein
MYLEDLVGLHEISGVDITTMEIKLYGDYEDINVVRFVLDGKTYKAIEDPKDGYRSYLDEIEVCDEVVWNNFPPQKVMGKMKDEHIIVFIDVFTDKVVLELGTQHIEDNYYPYCVMYWYPENLACNFEKYREFIKK